MNPLLKATRKMLRVPMRMFEWLEAQRMAEGCVLGEGSRLYPGARVLNFQRRREAIMIGRQCHVLGRMDVLAHGGTIRLGDSCFVGEGSQIWSAAAITIGNRVLISHGVNIHDHDSHSLSAERRQVHFEQIFSQGHPNVLEDVSSAPIVIEDDAWLGFGATVLKGVRIGRGAVVGAASVVTKDVAAYAVVAGNPARVIGSARQ
ncbi:MAG: acyltransferase [Acidobacteriota bacterium]